ncbi:MAG TPA: hypothetical protein VE621_20325, partial [Bryobacteraceae bacterium]|nr:hypothetical protein [Bryobacteraceae bacterium]
MFRRFTTFALLFVGVLRAWAEDPIFREIDQSLVELSKLTGMEIRKKVEYDTITKEKLRAYVEESVKQEVAPEDIRAEELTLKKLGLVPPEFDLAKTTIDLMTEQAAAFYDYRK